VRNPEGRNRNRPDFEDAGACVADWAQSRTPLDQSMVSFSRLELRVPAFAKNAIGWSARLPAAGRRTEKKISCQLLVFGSQLFLLGEELVVFSLRTLSATNAERVGHLLAILDSDSYFGRVGHPPGRSGNVPSLSTQILAGSRSRAPPSRKEREKGGAPAFLHRESLGLLPRY
jgi:hypothetical protein